MSPEIVTGSVDDDAATSQQPDKETRRVNGPPKREPGFT